MGWERWSEIGFCDVPYNDRFCLLGSISPAGERLLTTLQGADQGTAEGEVRWEGGGVVIYNVSL